MTRQETIIRPMKKVLRVAVMALLTGCSASRTASFRTDYLGIDINEKGYIVGLWNTYRVHISDTLIHKQADAMVQSGLKEAGYTYINIDDGFFGHRDEQGTMQPHPQRFPSGMKAVADYIHSLGLKAGIYSDAGAVTCGSIWDNDLIGIGAGLYGHEEQDARRYFLEWGYNTVEMTSRTTWTPDIDRFTLRRTE